MKISVFYPNILNAANESGLPLYEILSKAKKAGISALDFDYDNIKDGFPDEVVSSGLAVNSIYAFFDFTDDGIFEEAKEVINLAAEHNAVAMFVPAHFEKESISELKSIKERDGIFSWLDRNASAVRTAEVLEKLAVYGEKNGVFCAVENFDSHRSLTERLYEIEWLFSKAPHLRFNPDTGNSVTCGEDIMKLYDMFSEKVVNVHCKDRIEKCGKYVCTAAGAGTMPITEIRNKLLRSGYSGRFSVEVFGVKDMLSAIIESAENLMNCEE